MKCKGADPVAGAIKEERTNAIDDRFLHLPAFICVHLLGTGDVYMLEKDSG